MSVFTDASGREWRVDLDCFVLDRIRKEADVDLGDVSAAGLLAVERDVAALGRVLAVACDEQWRAAGSTSREFLRQIRGDALARAREAVMQALADFFPANDWSAMQSSLMQRKSQPDMTPDQLQLATAFLRMDPEVQRDVMQMIQHEAISGSSLPSPADPSVSDPDTMPQSPADGSPVSAASIPGD